MGVPIIKKIHALTNRFLRIGGARGNGLKHEAGSIDVRNFDDTEFQNIRAKDADGTDGRHAVTWQNLKKAQPLIEFGFDGAEVPAVGTNTGKFGMCHTSGEIWAAGDIAFDTGEAIEKIPVFRGIQISTNVAIEGTVSLIANGLYVAESAGAPYSWRLKGDGVPVAAAAKIIRMAFDRTDVESTTPIPAGAEVFEVITNIETPYDNDAKIEIAMGDTDELILQSVDDNDATYAASYISEPLAVVAPANAGVVKVKFSNTPTIGKGSVVIRYAEQFYN